MSACAGWRRYLWRPPPADQGHPVPSPRAGPALAELTAPLYLPHLDRKVAVLIWGSRAGVRAGRSTGETRPGTEGRESMMRLSVGASGWAFSISGLGRGSIGAAGERRRETVEGASEAAMPLPAQHAGNPGHSVPLPVQPRAQRHLWSLGTQKRCLSCRVHFESETASLVSGSSALTPVAGGTGAAEGHFSWGLGVDGLQSRAPLTAHGSGGEGPAECPWAGREQTRVLGLGHLPRLGKHRVGEGRTGPRGSSGVLCL